jgi:hypothetical protein
MNETKLSRRLAFTLRAALVLSIAISTVALSAQVQSQSITRDDLVTHVFHPKGMPTRTTRAQGTSVPAKISDFALRQIGLLQAEKATRTPAQRKLDSAILYSERMLQGREAAPGIPFLDTAIELDGKDRLAVDISAAVSQTLVDRLKQVGVLVLESHPNYNAIRARIPANKVEEIAAWPEIRFIAPQRNAVTAHVQVVGGRIVLTTPATQEYRTNHRGIAHRAITKALAAGSGSVDSEGDTTHKADVTRSSYGLDGSGLKIGVLSSGVDSLAQSQATGDLGPVTILPGQAGSGDEGTAMLEIIHDLAPGATLYFATAGSSIETFADNIHALQAAGCNVILDDVTFFVESPFHGGQSSKVSSPNDEAIAIQAVNDVTAAGVLYFSAAGNSGNSDSNGSSTWEGDFVDGGAATGTLAGAGEIHLFAPSTPYNTPTTSGGPVVLQWTDPLGASTNDYDLYLLSPDGAYVYDSSTNIQDGTQDPLEILLDGIVPTDLLAVVKHPSAKGVFLHLETFGAQLAVSTNGATFGHNAAENAFTVGATPAHLPLQDGLPSGPYPNPFNSSNVVEPYSSDGPRRIFFDADGNPITPGNFSSTGGKVLAKPDFVAADGVAISGAGGFPNPFYGTSAAAPHAAAIAALVLSAKPAFSRSDVATALASTAIDIMGSGADNSSGTGILMAYAAVASTGTSGFANPQLGTVLVGENPGNGDGVITAGEGAKLTIPVNNTATVTATGLIATLTTSDPGVYITQPVALPYSDLKTGDSAANDFTFTLPSDWNDCNERVDFTLNVAYTGGPTATRAFNFSVPVGPHAVEINGTFGTPASGIPGVTGSTGTQLGRTYRDGNPSVCGTPKVFPGTFDSNPYAFDAYSFTTCRNGCIPLDLKFPDSGINGTLFASAYSPDFNSGDPSVNYIGDAGVSGTDTPFAVPGTAGATIQAVITDATNTDAGETYTLKIPGCAVTCIVPNQLPVAVVQNVTVAAGADGTASASINNGSYDPDPGDTIALSQSPAGPYVKGSTSVMLTVTDSKGAVAQANATVNVVDAVTISPETTTASVTAGDSATYKLDVTTAAGEVTFACSGLPQGSSCSFNGFSPTSSNGEGVGSVEMTITTTASSMIASSNQPEPGSPAPLYAGFAIPLLGFATLRRRSIQGLLRISSLSVLWFVLLGWMGCGGSGNKTTTTSGTPSGNYSITVKAINSGGTANGIVSLTVK